jgi:phage terminase large subunit
VKALEATAPLVISIVRKTFPALKKSVYRDFIEIMGQLGLYNPDDHNKSSNTYRLNNCTIEFLSIDNAQKYKGSKRDILYCNEANELTFEDMFQLQIRTRLQVFIDYNPSDEAGWVYDLAEQRKSQVDFFKSTYLNNPFLDQTLVDEIERLRDTDDDYWNVYGLGERGKSRDLVYQFTQVEDIPTDTAELVALGLDWGYSQDPTALVEVWRSGDNLYLNELLYRRGLTNTDIAEELKGIGVDRRIDIIADSAEPKSIEEIRRSGYRIHPAKKGPDSVLNGIDILKRYRIHVTTDSTNLITELRRYKWLKDSNGAMMNRPIDIYNHALDAVRYVGLNLLSNKRSGEYNISIAGAGELNRVTGDAIREYKTRSSIR